MKDKKPTKRTLAERIERLTEQFTELNSRLNGVSFKNVKQDIRLDQLSEEISQFNQRHGNQQQQAPQRALQQQVAKLTSVIDALPDPHPFQAGLDAFQQQLTSLQATLQDLTTARNTDQQALAHLANGADDMRRDTDELTAHIRSLEESGSQLSVHDAQHDSQIQDLQGVVAELTRRLDDIADQEKNRQSISEQSLAEAISPLRDQLEQLGRQRAEQDERYRQSQSEMEALASQVAETGAKISTVEGRLATQDSQLQQSLEQRLAAVTAASDSLQQDKKQEGDRLAALDERVWQLELESNNRLEQQQEQQPQLLAAQQESFAEQLTTTAEHLQQQLDAVAGKARERDQEIVQLQQKLTTLQDESEALQQGDSTLTRQQQETAQALDDALQAQSTRLDEIRLQGEQRINSLEQRLTALATQLGEQTATEEQHGQRLDDLDTRLQAQQQGLETLRAEQQQSAQSASEEQQRLIQRQHQEASIQEAVTGLQSGHQQLVAESDRQAASLAALASDNNEQLVAVGVQKQQVENHNRRFDAVATTQLRHTLAIAGLFGLLLLTGLFGYQLFSDKLASSKRDLAAQVIRQGEGHVSRQEFQSLVTERRESAEDIRSIGTILRTQQGLQQRLQQVEKQLALPAANIPSTAASPTPPSLQPAVEQTQADISWLKTEITRLQTAQSNAVQREQIDDRFAAFEQTLSSLQQQIGQRLEQVDTQAREALSEQQGVQEALGKLTATVAELQQRVDQITLPEPAQRWLALQQSGGYSIQLIGSRSRQAILSFARKNALQGELAYVQSELNGQEWYTLLYGIYPGFSEASEALQALPESLRGNQPWIRLVPQDGKLTPL